MPENAGSYVAKSGAVTTIKARVFDADGNLLEDLGTIVGKRTKAAGKKTEAALKRLKARREKAEKGVNDG